jgi:hypothetical protein
MDGGHAHGRTHTSGNEKENEGAEGLSTGQHPEWVLKAHGSRFTIVHVLTCFESGRGGRRFQTTQVADGNTTDSIRHEDAEREEPDCARPA